MRRREALSAQCSGYRANTSTDAAVDAALMTRRRGGIEVREGADKLVFGCRKICTNQKTKRWANKKAKGASLPGTNQTKLCKPVTSLPVISPNPLWQQENMFSSFFRKHSDFVPEENAKNVFNIYLHG
jgi:hypothetical protein